MEDLTYFEYSQIIDDGYKHSLIVYEDTASKGMRLHAAVWEGELQQCPVWTAFSEFEIPEPSTVPARVPLPPRLAGRLVVGNPQGQFTDGPGY